MAKRRCRQSLAPLQARGSDRASQRPRQHLPRNVGEELCVRGGWQLRRGRHRLEVRGACTQTPVNSASRQARARGGCRCCPARVGRPGVSVAGDLTSLTSPSALNCRCKISRREDTYRNNVAKLRMVVACKQHRRRCKAQLAGHGHARRTPAFMSTDVSLPMSPVDATTSRMSSTIWSKRVPGTHLEADAQVFAVRVSRALHRCAAHGQRRSLWSGEKQASTAWQLHANNDAVFRYVLCRY